MWVGFCYLAVWVFTSFALFLVGVPSSAGIMADKKHINVNMAPLEELKQLPGIGDSHGQAIMDFHEVTSITAENCYRCRDVPEQSWTDFLQCGFICFFDDGQDFTSQDGGAFTALDGQMQLLHQMDCVLDKLRETNMEAAGLRALATNHDHCLDALECGSDLRDPMAAQNLDLMLSQAFGDFRN